MRRGEWGITESVGGFRGTPKLEVTVGRGGGGATTRWMRYCSFGHTTHACGRPVGSVCLQPPLSAGWMVGDMG